MSATRNNTIFLWHGGRRFSGWPEILPHGTSRQEAGPGFYMTNLVATASKYASNSGALFRIGLKPPTLASEVALPRAEIADFLRRSPAVRNRAPLLQDIVDGVHSGEDLSRPLALQNVVNLLVTHKSMVASRTHEIAAWLVGKGAQAAIDSLSRVEEWVTLFDPSLVVSCDKVSRSDILDDLPLPSLRLRECRETSGLASNLVDIPEPS
jgi:hypothetical protein